MELCVHLVSLFCISKSEFCSVQQLASVFCLQILYRAKLRRTPRGVLVHAQQSKMAARFDVRIDELLRHNRSVHTLRGCTQLRFIQSSVLALEQ